MDFVLSIIQQMKNILIMTLQEKMHIYQLRMLSLAIFLYMMTKVNSNFILQDTREQQLEIIAQAYVPMTILINFIFIMKKIMDVINAQKIVSNVMEFQQKKMVIVLNATNIIMEYLMDFVSYYVLKDMEKKTM